MRIRIGLAIALVLGITNWCGAQNPRGASTGRLVLARARGTVLPPQPDLHHEPVPLRGADGRIQGARLGRAAGSHFQRGHTGGFSGAIITQTGNATVTNLYTNPQEDTSVGIRHIPITVPVLGEITRYGAVLKKYPPKIVIGFAGN